MVSRQFVPTLAGLRRPRVPSSATVVSMCVGAATAVGLGFWPDLAPLGAPRLIAVPASVVALVALTLASRPG